MSRIILLGPQRFRPGVAAALDSVGCDGKLAVVTAGWQEREREVDELREHVNRDVVNLELWGRAEQVRARDPELAGALRARQDGLQRLQRLYRLRLAHALAAARELMHRPDRGEFLEEHRRGAIRALRTLDRQHLRRLRQLHLEFEQAWSPYRRPAVAEQQQQIAEELQSCGALAIAGGHVAALLNRLRLFNLLGLHGGRPVVAWSAGAMVLGQRLVLFHDHPPQGPGNAEVLDWGLGLCGGVLPLPHASRRLQLDDRIRVALFARRFSPAKCVCLDDGARIDWDGERWQPVDGTRRLTVRGSVRPMAAA